MKKKTVLSFAKINYNIEDVDYSYSDVKPRLFYTYATVQLPPSEFPESLRIGLPLEKTMEYVEKNNAGMAKYVSKVIESYDDKQDSELLAFETLHREGFDLTQFMRYMLDELSIEIELTPAKK